MDTSLEDFQLQGSIVLFGFGSGSSSLFLGVTVGNLYGVYPVRQVFVHVVPRKRREDRLSVGAT